MHDNAWLYDLENRDFRADIPFWESILDDYTPKRVLDVACGTGRITFPLLEHGWGRDSAFCMVGLDNSPPLLTRAQELIAERDEPLRAAVHLVEADMRSFDLGEQFDLILIGFNSLAYIHTLEDHRSCLRAIRRHLAPGGHFAFDLIVPHFSFLAEAQLPVPAVRLEVDIAAPELGVKRLLRFATERYDAVTQTDDTTYFYEIYHADGRYERFTDDLAWHMYFPHELTILLEEAGFTPVERWGNYARAPFGPRSTQYLWVCEGDGGG